MVERDDDAVEEREEVEDEDNTVDEEEEVNEAVDSLKSLSFVRACEGYHGIICR